VNIYFCRRINRPTRYQRGHVTLLTAILFLVIGLTTIGMFNVGQQSTNKVRVQTVSDAAAHSVAMVVARDLNFKAFTNRAMVANQVAIAQVLGLASWSLMLDNAATNFSRITTVFGWIPGVAALGQAVSRAASAIQNAISRAAPQIIRVQERILDALAAAQVTFNLATVDMARETFSDVISQSDSDIDTAALSTNGVLWKSFRDTWDGQQDRFRDQRRGDNSRDAREHRARLEEFRGITERSADRFVDERSYNWLPEIGFPVAARMRKYGGTDLMPGSYRDSRGVTRENFNWTAMDSVGFETRAFRFDPLDSGWTSWGELFPFGWGAGHALLGNNRNFNYSARVANRNSRWGNGTWRLNAATTLGARRYGGNNLAGSNGLRPFYDLRQRGVVGDDRLSIQVLLLKRANNVRTYNRMLTENGAQAQPRFNVEERGGMAGNTMATLAKAGVYFSREHARRRDGQREYGNLYNPYWQVHLLPTTNGERIAALGFAQVSAW
jgi:hypothetical protein